MQNLVSCSIRGVTDYSANGYELLRDLEYCRYFV